MLHSIHKSICLLFIIVFASNSGISQCLDLEVQQINAICTSTNGSALISPLNGTPPYEYDLPTTNITINQAYNWQNLSPGPYSVIVTDANNCSGTAEFVIQEDPGNLDVAGILDFEICGAECIDLWVSPTSNCFNFTYEWTGPNGFFSTNAIPFTCDPGTYNVTVMDCYGCTATTSINIITSPIINFNIQNIVNSSCNSGCTGLIDINTSGGVLPYTFQWNNGELTEDLFDACPGTYSVTIIDAVGCLAQGTFTVDCQDLNIQTSRVFPSCEGVCDGSISANITGGTPPYSFNWSNGQTGQTISNLCAGFYQVTVVDALNIIGTNLQDTLGYQMVLEYEVVTTAISCSAGGSIEVNMLNGSGDFTYSLNGAVVGSNVMANVTGLTNNVAVVDNVSGCMVSIPVELEPPFELIVATTIATCDMNDGTATASVNNSSSTFTYEWSNGMSGAIITNLAPGGYSVTATDDSNGCLTHENIYIEEDPICFAVVSGYVIDDSDDMDCLPTITTDSVALQLISLDDTQFTFTDQNGYFSFQTTPGVHTIKYESNNLLYSPLCADPITTTSLSFGDTTTSLFYLQKNNVIDLRMYIVKNAIRPGFQHTIFANIFNAGNPIIDGSLIFTHDINQTFESANPAPTSYDPVSRIITWDFGNMDQISSAIYAMTFSTDPSLELGTEITMGGVVNPVTEDINPDNNSQSCIGIVTGSYDPNDKSVFHEGEVFESDPTIIWPNSTDNFRYLVRFQNTGTDTAFTVVIEDELDAKFDVRNITPGPASHPYDLNVRDGNILEFTFENILLPDSTTNEVASHGHVFFDVKIPLDFPIGENILNDAAIFFDFNTPIITNEVSNIFDFWLANEEFENSLDMQLFPNPTNGEASLFFNLKETANISIEILDIYGKTIQQLKKNEMLFAGDHQLKLNQNELTSGTYFIKINSGNDIASKKLVILK